MAKTQPFDREILRGIIHNDADGYTVIESNITDVGRWSVHYECIFRCDVDGMFFRTEYSVGATEYQDERPYEYDGDTIDVTVVKPVEKVTVEYFAVED